MEEIEEDVTPEPSSDTAVQDDLGSAGDPALDIALDDDLSPDAIDDSAQDDEDFLWMILLLTPSMKMMKKLNNGSDT